MTRKRNENPSAGDLAEALGKSKDLHFKSYKADGSGFDDLEEGQEIIGVFVSVRQQHIKDKRTKQQKPIRVYSIRVEDGSTKKIGSRTLLDRMFDDVMDEHGGMTADPMGRYTGPGIDWIKGRVVKFVRGDDTKTADDNPMGTYEILVEED